ncbi:DUF3054 domain-containing protein [Nocardioides ferulae]|uniref:DUF3054 domain-containing protein n=1 Tax=Nocardioides ferulae TaxID=2340821 RepID=UPI00197E212C|nr:DUF3054 domain-containing protein [Nocardioides ferulae]
MRRPVHPALTVAIDAAVVILFAALGRRSHDEGGALGGVLDTAWPFLAGLALGHLLVRGSASLRAGSVVWGCAVVGGMLLRRLTGDGTAWSFVLVATGFLGALLLGWRLASRLLVARRR